MPNRSGGGGPGRSGKRPWRGPAAKSGKAAGAAAGRADAKPPPAAAPAGGCGGPHGLGLGPCLKARLRRCAGFVRRLTAAVGWRPHRRRDTTAASTGLPDTLPPRSPAPTAPDPAGGAGRRGRPRRCGPPHPASRCRSCGWGVPGTAAGDLFRFSHRLDRIFFSRH